jgi:hypothetical protein
MECPVTVLVVFIMSLEEQIQERMQDIRDIIGNFRVIGSGISGSFQKGYDLQQPDNVDPDMEIIDPLPEFGQDPFVGQ